MIQPVLSDGSAQCLRVRLLGLEQVREISAALPYRDYNEERLHEALAGLPPATYRAQLEVTSPQETTAGLRKDSRYLFLSEPLPVLPACG